MDSGEPGTGEKQTISEGVYRALRKDILTLAHDPGAPLREQDLAAHYGSSRVPVREAFGRLQQEGLVTSVPYKGYFVARISLKEIADSFGLRVVLETHAVACAVERASDEDLSRLEALAAQEYTYDDWDSYGTFLRGNREFHIALAALGGNSRLDRVLGDLLDGMQRYFFLGLDLGDYGSEMREEHERLCRAIRARSTEDAVRFVREQIQRSRERILEMLVRERADLPLS
ncbi:MAG: GntR family transcriptional regulator [Planctomycetota bacterium]|jgi:DNA-binding GntR family transcriptional regulator